MDYKKIRAINQTVFFLFLAPIATHRLKTKNQLSEIFQRTSFKINSPQKKRKTTFPKFAQSKAAKKRKLLMISSATKKTTPSTSAYSCWSTTSQTSEFHKIRNLTSTWSQATLTRSSTRSDQKRRESLKVILNLIDWPIACIEGSWLRSFTLIAGS